jgi:hypothetical protein
MNQRQKSMNDKNQLIKMLKFAGAKEKKDYLVDDCFLIVRSSTDETKLTIIEFDEHGYWADIFPVEDYTNKFWEEQKKEIY